MFRALLSATAAIHLLSFAPPAAADVDIDRLVREAGLETGAVAMRDRDEWRAPRKVLFRGASWIDLDVEGLVSRSYRSTPWTTFAVTAPTPTHSSAPATRRLSMPPRRCAGSRYFPPGPSTA